MQEKVLIVMISSGNVEEESRISAEHQDYSNYEFIIKVTPAQTLSSHEVKNKYLNCSHNRNLAREIALKYSADYYLFMDDDIILPENAIKSLVSRQKDVVGGWYKMVKGNNWVAGRWVSENTFFNFKFPEKGLVLTDVVGLGCALIKKEVLEMVKFESGTELFCNNEWGETIIVGECGVFGRKVQKLGYNLYMDGNVICDHIDRRKFELNL